MDTIILIIPRACRNMNDEPILKSLAAGKRCMIERRFFLLIYDEIQHG